MEEFSAKQFKEYEALGLKLQIFHDSIVLQIPEETWAQRKPSQI